MNTFYNTFDLERLSGRPALKSEFRTAFQVDRDRVLHTPSFRRLQNKTQVFWAGEYDFYRTRLTHSLEVAQIGRSICYWLLKGSEQTSSELREDFFIDPDLVEAACLSHDLGHPPFGHAGEKVLNYHLQEAGGFEGNAQTLRLLTERIFSQSRQGMDPTRAFLDSVLKYKTLYTELTHGKEYPENHFIYDEQVQYLDWVLGGNVFPVELLAGKVRDEIKSIECQIMDWADDAAYCLNDLADASRAGFLSEGAILEWAEQNGEASDAESSLGELIRAIRKNQVDLFVGRRIGAYIKAVSLVLDVNFLSGTSNRYRYRLVVDRDIREESRLFKKLAYQIVFQNPRLKQLEYKGTHMLSRLWTALEQEYIAEQSFHGQRFSLLPEEESLEIQEAKTDEEKKRLLCDYLAAQTDGSALRLYQRLFVAGQGSIGDLIMG